MRKPSHMKKPYPKYKMTNTTTPRGWKKMRVDEAFSFIPTTSHSKDKLTDEPLDSGIYYIHYGDIHAKYKDYVDFSKHSIPRLKENEAGLDRNVLKTGDLVMVDASEDLPGVGTCIEIKNLNDKKCIAGLHTFGLRDSGTNTASGYRTLALRHPSVKTRMKKVSTYSKVYGISKKSLSEIELILPPLPEQNRIVAVLETWDQAIEDIKKKIEIKKNVKKGLMQKLLTGQVRLPGFNEEWEGVELGNILQEVSEKTTESNQYEIFSVTKNGIVPQSTYFDKQIASQDNTGYKIIRKNNLVFSAMNLWMGSLDFFNNEIGIVSPAYKIFTINENIGKVDFFRGYLKTPYMLNVYKNNSEQGASIVRRNLDLTSLLTTPVQIPKTDEQIAIANILTTADKEIETLEKKLSLLEDQKKYLLNNLITGKIRVPENN